MYVIESALSYGMARTLHFKLIFGVVWLGFTLGMMAMVGLNETPDGEILKLSGGAPDSGGM